MYYAQVYLRNLKGIFTWESSTPLSVGDRVVVPFRKAKRIGIVIDISLQKPDFKTQPILEYWDKGFIDPIYVELVKEITTENFCGLEKVFSLLIPEKFLQERAPAKQKVTYKLIDGTAKVRGEKQQWVIDTLRNAEISVSKEVLRKEVALSTLKNLEEKEIITSQQGLFHAALKADVLPTKIEHELTETQQGALDSILKSNKPSLLWGVTGSGKTEIYKAVAKKILAQEKQTLLLLPEIALTSQLIAEFRSIFGEQLAVWHSNLSTGEKIQEWERVRTGQAKILIGARSAIMVPMPNLGLIILDEEHEWTYKNEFNPRFWTHDVAVKLTEKFKAKMIFGSATPRLESLHQVELNNWDLIRLKDQVFKTAPPLIEIRDMANETKKGNYTPVSVSLENALRETMEAGRQAVLFLNKRGFAGATMCRHCGERFECPDCSANMKVHGYQNPVLICHICAHMEAFPTHCLKCKKTDFKFSGWGTQQVEKWFKEKFPHRKILRADRDTVTKKHDFEQMMHQFYHHEADVLLGTQMVAKGLDFAKVDLVGVILADVGLNLPDFRSEERVFQLLTQVSGRAGRRDTPGKIIVQTFRPEDEIYEYLRTQDIDGFIAAQQIQRQKLQWSPYSNAVKITFHNESKATTFANTKNMFDKLKKEIETQKLGIEIFWVPAFMPKAHNKYWFHIILKHADKKIIMDLLRSHDDFGDAKIDMTPASLL